MLHLPYPALAVLHLLLCLPSTNGAPNCAVCWPAGHSQDPVVGLDFTLGYGTSVVRFPNGTFANVAYVEGNESYQSWMQQGVIDIGRTADFGILLSTTSAESKSQPADTKSFGLLRLPAMLRDLPKYFWAKHDLEQPTQARTSEQDTSILELVEALKEQAETYLSGTIFNVSASFPVFFNATHKATLTSALTQAGLHDPGCHPDGNAMGAALTASNVAQSKCPQSNFECTRGPVGFRWVLAVEHTDMALSAALFESLVGYTAARLRDGTYFIEVKPTNDDPAPTEDQTFWDTVRSQTLDLVRRKPRGSEISQIILFGTSSHDPQLHKILNEVIGDLVSSEGLRQAGSNQNLSTGHGASTLPVSVQLNKTEESIDPIFAAARGATLYSLQSALEPCLQSCSILVCEEKRGRVWEVYLEKPSESQEEPLGKLAEL